ncbi:metal-dependent phosphohydrolase [Devosia insulae DS-56]|uniref:Metal-dependent phosphohydrolase n=1 Tax=Devosia insulae DS-56 TaxID=1116389 RepID=A0A1E5XQT7_9HYPH|nr:HD-GYP domain-containing protein [Devosia insulae]OEO30966.1 metal-dependent phosphohydrolase [Devosia insulae DS-56]
MFRAAASPSARAQIGLAELVSALSHALDITEGQPVGHGVRCCWIGMQMGQALGFDEPALGDLYYALLLKDVGCSSNAARICQLYLADDLSFKHGFKQVDSALPQILRFVFAHTGLKAGLAARFRSIVHIAMHGGEIARELIETRCTRGAEIARQMRFSEAVAGAILDLDEHWNGNGKPLGRIGNDISPLARIALLAQVVDVFFMSSGPEAAIGEVERRTGAWFDPACAAAFLDIARDAQFWTTLAAPDLEQRVIALEPQQRSILVDDDYLDDIAAAFAKVVDAKSPYTSGHSDRVALFADLIAEQFGFSDERRRWLKRAALLHDIGKLGVSNQILDKPGKPDPDEWAAIRQHPALGETILGRISALAELARVAGAHHERLDGKGYPRGLDAVAIDLETRVVTTADVFDALTAERPYRAAMSVSQAFAIMDADAGTAIDPSCLAALKRAMLEVEAAAA